MEVKALIAVRLKLTKTGKEGTVVFHIIKTAEKDSSNEIILGTNAFDALGIKLTYEPRKTENPTAGSSQIRDFANYLTDQQNKIDGTKEHHVKSIKVKETTKEMRERKQNDENQASSMGFGQHPQAMLGNRNLFKVSFRKQNKCSKKSGNVEKKKEKSRGERQEDKNGTNWEDRQQQQSKLVNPSIS